MFVLNRCASPASVLDRLAMARPKRKFGEPRQRLPPISIVLVKVTTVTAPTGSAGRSVQRLVTLRSRADRPSMR